MKHFLLCTSLFFCSLRFFANGEVFPDGRTTGNFILHYFTTETGDRVENHALVAGKQFLPAEDIDSINARLQWVYEQYGIECYFVLMEYFDLKINASSQQHQSLDSLFGSSTFYSQNSLVDTMRKYQNATGRWMKSTLANSINRPVILVNIARYHAIYTDEEAVNYYLSLHYSHKPSNAPLPDYFDDIYRNFLERTAANNKNGAHLFNETLVYDYAQQWKESVIKINLQKQLLTTYTSAGLKNILQYFEAGDIDYKRLSLEERLHCLNVFAGENMSGANGIVPGEEEYALWIIEHTPASQVSSLLSGLNSVLEQLVSKIDGENYTRLQKVLVKVIRSSPTYSDQLTLLFSEQQISKKIFSWNDTWINTPVVGHVKYLVSFTESKKLKIVTKRVVDVITSTSSSGNVPVYSIIYADEPEIILHYFEPVLFLSDCEINSFAEAGADKGVPLIVPAIFLKFAQDKEWNDDLLTGVAVVGDVVTLAAAPLAWTKAITWTRKAWVAFEAANALGNLSINTLGSDLPPEFQDIVQKSNYLMLAVGGKNILKGGYSSLSLALAGTKEITGKIPRELAQQLARSLLEDASPGLTKLDQLRTLSGTSASANALTKFYEKLKSLYRDSFNKDLELDLVPLSPSVLPDWVKEIRTVEDYLAKVPDFKRQEILDAFQNGAMEIVICAEDFDLIRHISLEGYAKSYWFAKNILNPSDAKRLLALPNSNTAKFVTVSRVKKGTPYLKGTVASQTASTGFGSYATGGGEQYFFLKEIWEDDNLVRVIESIKPNPLDI